MFCCCSLRSSLIHLFHFLANLLSHFAFGRFLIAKAKTFVFLSPIFETPFEAYLPNADDPYDPMKARTFQKKQWKNWAETQNFRPDYFHLPKTETHIRSIIQFANRRGEKVRAVGCGHSPSDICIATHMISLERMNSFISINYTQKLVKIEAGMTLTALNTLLRDNHLAMPCLGSISEQTIAGALATGTHGSGATQSIIASQVTELTLVDGLGRVRILRRDEGGDELFRAVVLGVGSMGIITQVALRVVEAFDLRAVSVTVDNEAIYSQLLNIALSDDYVRIHFYPHTGKGIVTRMRCLDPNDKESGDVAPIFPFNIVGCIFGFFWQKLQRLVSYHLLEFLYFIALFLPSLIPKINALYRTLFFSFTRTARDTSVEIFNFDCRFRQHVIEFAIPFEKTVDALIELQEAINKTLYCHFPIELRFMKADDILISPCYSTVPNQLFSYINLVMYKPYNFEVNHLKLWNKFSNIMLKYNGRPHWAKSWVLPLSTLHRLYPEFERFSQIRRELDPQNVFRNEWADRLFPDSNEARKSIVRSC